ncbi:excalibur calcium-binding domain-containing protein [Synechococcus sp. CB0205]|uniref:excalibur calcium-binding domain-containing protein n=1 Tax=Synechococcus sp. CB0205 TaxID=232363 RepID=UPI00350F8DB8
MKRVVVRATVCQVTIAPSSSASLAQNCSSFSNCGEAVAAYCSRNSKRDRDKDGITRENLCGRNGEMIPSR